MRGARPVIGSIDGASEHPISDDAVIAVGEERAQLKEIPRHLSIRGRDDVVVIFLFAGKKAFSIGGREPEGASVFVVKVRQGRFAQFAGGLRIAVIKRRLIQVEAGDV